MPHNLAQPIPQVVHLQAKLKRASKEDAVNEEKVNHIHASKYLPINFGKFYYSPIISNNRLVLLIQRNSNVMSSNIFYAPK